MRFPTPTEWLKLVEEFRASELTMKEFVQKHDVSFNTCQYWVYRKSKQVQLESKLETKFLPVTVVASAALKARRSSPVEVIVELERGPRLRVLVGTDTKYIAELAAALG